MTVEGHEGNRVALFDYARGMAIVLVVLGHAIHMVSRQFPSTMPAWVFDLDRAIYTFHVPIFFLISGVLFAGSFDRRGGRGLLWHRVKTLLYPYVLWSMLHVISQSVGNGQGFRSLWGDVFRITYFPPAHFWFLYVLFICVAVAVAFRRVFTNERSCALALLLLSLCWYGVYAFLPPGPLRDTGRSLPYFVVGAMWSALGGSASRMRSSWALVVGAWVLFVITVSAAVFYDLETGPILRLPLGLMGVVATWLTAGALTEGAGTRGLAMVGRGSLTIYLVHVFVIYGFCLLLHCVNAAWWITLPIVVASGIVLPLILERMSRRLKIAIWLGLG